MDFSEYKNHIEYLGYKVREQKDDKNSTIFAEANAKPNFNISKIATLPFLIVRSNWSIVQTTPNLYEIVNTLNEKAVNISSVWYYKTSENQPALGISSAYFEPYDKERFATFLDAFLADINRVLNREEAKPVLS